MSDFIVRFEGVKLSQEQSRHVQAAIGAAVESALANAGFTPNPEGDSSGGGHVVFIPNLWNGRWILPQAALANKPDVFKTPLEVAIGGQTRSA